LYATLNAIDRVGGDRVQLAIIDPDTPELRQQAEERGIRGEALEQRDDVEAKVSLLYFGVYMQLGEDSTIVELLSQRGLVTDLEYRILKEIKRLNRDSDESGIAFVEAPGSMTAYPLQRGQPPTKDNISVFQQLVTEEKGQLEQINLTRPIPSTVETVFLTGMPRLEEIEFYHLDQFLMRGGNLILMLRGVDFQLNSGGGMQQFGGASMGFAQPAYEDLHRLNTWLGQYGILLNGNLVIEPEQGLLINDPLFRTPRPQPYMGWAGYTREDGNLVSNDPAMSGFDILVFPWTSTLDVRNAAQPNVNFETLVQTSGVALLRDSTAMDYGSINNVEGIDAGEPVNEPRPVAVLASGKFHSAFTRDTLPGTIDEEGNPGDPPADFREGQVGDTLSKLAVIATPYMVTDLMMGDRYYIPMPNFEFFRVNSAFLMNLLEQMEGDTDLIAARSRVSSPARIVLQSSILRFLFTVFHIFALPVLLAAYGMLRLVSRNRRRGVESAGGSNG
ncbi:MAG: Gldg family protein, partial [Leptospiraceae bacterium]|nr:Gldg family protein [Leptospiraceae bacterium]